MRSTARFLLLALLVATVGVGTPQNGGPSAAAASPSGSGDVVTAMGATGHAVLAALPPGGTFTDDNGNIFEGAIEAIAAEGITKGCNPPSNSRFCPGDSVTRGEMAVFIARAKHFSAGSDYFVDDAGRFYEQAANRIRQAGVTNGCNPPSNNRYCGELPITRGQMAALLVRALGLTDDGGGDLFDDDNGSQFEKAIDRLATAGITQGCNPPDNDRFCPNDDVTRGQMAAFIARALGLSPIIPPPADQVVTGTLELSGKVTLQGDLIVDGGKLIARSGVDVNGNGHEILFMNGGVADWNGAKFRNLDRIMFHHCAGPSTIRNTEVINSGVTGELGLYPLHWHLNGNCTRGTLVENVTVRGGKNHAFVPHGSHGITFRNIEAFNTIEDAFWWDLPNDKNHTANNSNDIKIDGALIDGVEPPGNDRGLRLTGFNLGAGKGNEIRNAVVRNVNGDKNCAAYHWPEEANHNRGGNEWLFENNVGTSDCHGIFVWQNDGGDHIITNFSGGGISHGAYDTPGYRYINPDVPYFEAHAVDFRVEGGSVGRVIGASGRFDGDATFVNTEVTSLRINNSTNKPAPVHYIFQGTGLKCSNVSWVSVKPGTKVTIDGNPCTP